MGVVWEWCVGADSNALVLIHCVGYEYDLVES